MNTYQIIDPDGAGIKIFLNCSGELQAINKFRLSIRKDVKTDVLRLYSVGYTIEEINKRKKK